MQELERSAAPISRKNVLWLTAVLFTQIAAMSALSLTEADRSAISLDSIPATISDWKAGAEHLLEPEVASLLKPDTYLYRTYSANNQTPDVTLFIGYFKSRTGGHGPHSPKVCLPSSGWMEEYSRVATIPLQGGKALSVNEYVLQKGRERILALYWYQNAHHTWAEEIWGKMYLLPELFRERRSDVSFVRIIIPLPPGDTQMVAVAKKFAAQVSPLLTEHLAKAR